MATSKITFRTNYNNKLDCPHFIHIDLAPSGSVTETVLNNTVIEISTADQSHTPVQKKITDLAKARFKDIRGIFFHLSHGMTSEQYLQLAKKENKKIDEETMMALYYYSPL